MVKVAKTKLQKIIEISTKFPGEFEKGPLDSLLCVKCNVSVKFGKMFNVEQHRKSASHQRFSDPNKIQSRLTTDSPDFATKCVKMMGQANIPLKKLREPAFFNFFSEIGYKTPSESYARTLIQKFCPETLTKIFSLLSKKKIFLIIDETQIDRKKFVHVLAGTIDNPEQIFLVEHKFVETANSQTICGIIHDVLNSIGCKRENFTMLISDAAPYMIASAKVLEVMYPKMIFTTCFVHLLHNCAMKVRAAFPEVDKLIASMRMATLKSSKRCELFKDIPLPPDVIITRWGSWLDAADYYSKNFIAVKEIVEQFEDTGKITENVKAIFKSNEIKIQLANIKNDYSDLNLLISKCENSFFNIKNAIEAIKELKFGSDSADIKKYFEKRIANMNLKKIENGDIEINPEDISNLWNCPATSISVERSFSMLGKLLRKDRNFKIENIKAYMVEYYNKF